jgi:hypothetical protein
VTSPGAIILPQNKQSTVKKQVILVRNEEVVPTAVAVNKEKIIESPFFFDKADSIEEGTEEDTT